MSDKILFNVKEVAKMLGIGESTIWAMVRDNEFVKPFKLAGSKWHLGDIQEFLASKRKHNESK